MRAAASRAHRNGTGDVDRPQAREHRLVDGVERAVATGDAGVVDEHVEPAEVPIDLAEHLQHRRLVAHVGAHRKRIASPVSRISVASSSAALDDAV